MDVSGAIRILNKNYINLSSGVDEVFLCSLIAYTVEQKLSILRGRAGKGSGIGIIHSTPPIYYYINYVYDAYFSAHRLSKIHKLINRHLTAPVYAYLKKILLPNSSILLHTIRLVDATVGSILISLRVQCRKFQPGNGEEQISYFKYTNRQMYVLVFNIQRGRYRWWLKGAKKKRFRQDQ